MQVHAIRSGFQAEGHEYAQDIPQVWRAVAQHHASFVVADLVAHCAGLDVHKDTVVACVRHRTDGKVTTTIKTFNTATQELLALSDWLSPENATHIAMEAAGVYWKPVWNILSDGEFKLVLGNAAHIKNVPGRKTGAPATGLCRWGGRPGPRRQVFVAGVEDRGPGDRSLSLGWKTDVKDAAWLADLMAHG